MNRYPLAAHDTAQDEHVGSLGRINGLTNTKWAPHWSAFTIRCFRHHDHDRSPSFLLRTDDLVGFLNRLSHGLIPIEHSQARNHWHDQLFVARAPKDPNGAHTHDTLTCYEGCPLLLNLLLRCQGSSSFPVSSDIHQCSGGPTAAGLAPSATYCAVAPGGERVW